LPPSHAPSTRSRTATAAVLAALALTAAGCGGGDSSSPAAPSTSSAASEPGSTAAVASTVKIGTVAGVIRKHNRKVFETHRKQVLSRVGKAVDQWLDGAFVGVDYPRQDFPSAFASFTADAKRDARRQQRLMTNWEWRHKIDGVVVKRRTVDVDVLAPHGRPAGATARVHLAFTTTGDVHRRVTVTGRLFLTPAAHGSWRVFGFDVAKGAK
jgi:hypothetical protein